MCGKCNWTASSHIHFDRQMCCKDTLVCFVTLRMSSWVMWCWALPFQHLTELATWYGVTWLNLPQSDILWFGNMCRVQVTSVGKWCVLFNHAVSSNDCIISEIDKWMSNEHWSCDTDSGKPEYLGKLLSQCNFVHHILHMDWSGIKWGPSWWEASA